MLGGSSVSTLGGDGKHDLWRHLSLLAKVESKDSMEEVLRTLWRTRRTGLSPADRADLRGALQVQSDAELDPLLVCLRVLIRGCMTAAEALREEQSESGDVDGSLVDVEALIPADEVGLEVRRLLGLVLQKLLREWFEDVAKEKAWKPTIFPFLLVLYLPFVYLDAGYERSTEMYSRLKQHPLQRRRRGQSKRMQNPAVWLTRFKTAASGLLQPQAENNLRRQKNLQLLVQRRTQGLKPKQPQPMDIGLQKSTPSSARVSLASSYDWLNPHKGLPLVVNIDSKDV